MNIQSSPINIIPTETINIDSHIPSINNETKPSSDKTFIFGDIEGKETLFSSTMQTIASNTNSNFIFLGDIYDYMAPYTSISMVEKILTILKIPLLQQFDESSKEIDIIRVFRKLWKTKQLKSYSKFNIQFLHSKPKQEKPIYDNQFFIMGNKEVIFIQEIIECGHITKLPDNSFLVPADYKGKNITRHTDYHFTYHHLNVMLTYLSLCNNYIIQDDILYIHCYINYKQFKDIEEISHVVSGHSKGYGHFKDDNFPNIDIFMCDLTNDELVKTDEPTNFILKDGNNIIYKFNEPIKPRLEKIHQLD